MADLYPHCREFLVSKIIGKAFAEKYGSVVDEATEEFYEMLEAGDEDFVEVIKTVFPPSALEDEDTFAEAVSDLEGEGNDAFLADKATEEL